MQYNSEKTEIGEQFFKYRDYTPIPLILLLLFVQAPTVRSAVFGLLLMISGELFRIYAVAFIGSISRTRKNRTGDHLIDSGPFAWMRNPLYVGNFGIAIGAAVFSGRWWFVLLTAALFAIQYYHIVKYEEQLLFDKFGEEYRDYCDRVPAWIPKRLPRLEEVQWPDSFAEALRSEKRTLTTVCALLILLLVFVKDSCST